MADYVLCSSSTEEGEIIESKTFEPIHNSVFPRSFSILKDWYLPDSQYFIGVNTIPGPKDYPCGLPLTRLKKKLRKDMPHLFNIISLNKDRSFFNNKFELITVDNNNELEIDKMFMTVFSDNIKNVSSLDHITSLTKSQYGAMCDIFSFDDKRHEVIKNVGDHPECTKFIFIRDSIVDKLDFEDVFNFFRVIKSRKGISYVFEDSYFRRIKFNDYLELYLEEVMRSKNSFETRTYIHNDTFIAVFSSSVFNKDDILYRYYDGLDVDKNFIAFVNKESIETRKRNLLRKDNFSVVLSLNLEEGDYAINNERVYKVGINGDKHEYEGLILDDF